MNEAATLQVRDIARLAGTTPDTVRYYCRIGLLQPVRDRANGYKRFSRRDLKRLEFIQRAKRLGFTLGEIRQFLEVSNRGDTPCPQVREIMQRRIIENRRRLEECLSLQNRMEQALYQWRDMPDGVPDGDAVCHLIESFEETPTNPARHGEQQP